LFGSQAGRHAKAVAPRQLPRAKHANAVSAPNLYVVRLATSGYVSSNLPGRSISILGPLVDDASHLESELCDVRRVSSSAHVDAVIVIGDVLVAEDLSNFGLPAVR